MGRDVWNLGEEGEGDVWLEIAIRFLITCYLFSKEKEKHIL